MMMCDFVKGLKCEACPFGEAFECPCVESWDEAWDVVSDLMKKLENLQDKLADNSEA